jgi:hypothetical protein
MLPRLRYGIPGAPPWSPVPAQILLLLVREKKHDSHPDSGSHCLSPKAQARPEIDLILACLARRNRQW